MRALILTTAAVVAALALAWTGGLEHQANCVHAGKVGCSVLPWQDGHLSEQDRLVQKYGLDGFGP
jgi:hypothetical protein